MRNTRLYIAALAILTTGLLLWWLLPPRVVVATPTRGAALQGLFATGTVEPRRMLPIAPRVSARIQEITVDEGAVVKSGDLLARLDDAEAKANLADLSTRAALANEEFGRITRLVGLGAFSKADYDKAHFGLLSAQAARVAAEARMDYLQLRAPSNGLVIRRDGEVGELIPVNQPIFWLSDDQPLRVIAEVDEEDIPQVTLGARVLIRADAFPGQVFTAQVDSITPKGDPISRSFRVRINLDKENPLRIGMTAETNIIVHESKDALLVASGALLGNTIWTLVDGKLRSHRVEVGARGPEQTEIKAGLAETDLVVIAPTTKMRDGMRAREKLLG